MTEQLRYDELDRAIDAIISRGELTPTGDPGLDALARVASGLRGLPTPELKARLREELFPKPARRPWPLFLRRNALTVLLQQVIKRPRLVAPLAFATAAVVAAVIAVLVVSPFGERAAEEEAFGALPAPVSVGGKGGGGIIEPSGKITYTLSPDLSLPASALAYRLLSPEVTSESVAEIARRLGIEGPVEFTPAEDGGGKGGDIPASYMVASEGRFFQMMEDGHFSYHDDALSGDVKHAPPDAQAPTEQEARAAAEAWLRLTGLTGDDPYTLTVLEPVQVPVFPEAKADDTGEVTDGEPVMSEQPFRDVLVTPERPANQIFDSVQIVLLVTSDGEIAQVSGYWPTIDAESGYPLHSAEQLLINLKNLREEFNFLELIGGKDQPPMLADRLQDASATVESVEVAYTLGIGEDGRAYLLPVYIVRGHLTQEGLAEPVPFATWVPATGPTAGPPQAPEGVAALQAVAESLPLPEGSTPFGAPSVLGVGLVTSYFVEDGPEEVAEFYRRELLGQGWQEENPPAIRTTEALGFAVRVSLNSFVKGDTRVAITVAPNEKDASKGATLLLLTVEPRVSEFAPVRDSLPLYPGAEPVTYDLHGVTVQVVFDAPYGLQSTYSVAASVEDVAEFYARELPKGGWRAEGTLADILTGTVDPTRYESVQGFVKEGVRVLVLLAPAQDEPGITVLDIVVEPAE